MPTVLDNEEYMTISEALAYLGVNREQLRLRTLALSIKQYSRDLSPKLRYYKKVDLDRLRAFRPVEDDGSDEHDDGDGGA